MIDSLERAAPSDDAEARAELERVQAITVRQKEQLTALERRLAQTQADLDTLKIRAAEAHLPRVSSRALLIAGLLLGVIGGGMVQTLIPTTWWATYDRWLAEDRRELKANPPKFVPPRQVGRNVGGH